MINYLILFYIISFLIGTIIGSFLNVCIYRISKEQSIAYPPSHCPSCNSRLKVFELVPILSYLLLKGKCRYCNDKISFKYPIIEFFTGIIFLSLAMKYGISVNFFKYSVLLSILVVISFIDIETMNIYFSVTLTGIVFGVIFLIIQGSLENYTIKDYSYYLFGAIIPSAIIALIILITKGMGWGDVEICFISGIFLGVKLSMVMILASFILGSIISIILISFKVKGRKDYIAFGPFIALGTLFAIFLGDRIILWYLSLI
ncbi:leader peptidase (prepilin peptidase)/N-methyltransferase [Clostridium tetanomorphum]|uniref:Prepilin peptidase n=1 Tax=Clostridium tetanomorphum TaxID=1553 RepID=A0A923EDR3_CLOTT|nr:A24 family peptidase [Clostridium tetanomorphum]KAJ49140.1 hypothetical protein CTM_24708 [Clostridium tetanomorphum DSM 665]KAJ53628.1 hypothetical protein CTM_01569 [Clostridium tetanomorphum DSM 665]MBC2399631.1 prepilin peptidase [Clostridium tetanomorphum]MBP1866249.1 leader peptidase (prepilin peptidase)/N-methyltransferase [Clostridium tetanomorphum]NRS86007.1 leader peptidase (prepilin peptidase)/N-methyltransferase [Clostridium tetanomorphum]